MASWRDGLRRGSFRGVPFLCRDTSNLAGQRLALFEIPDSDSAYVQPLGRGPKEYRLEVYVVGDDYMAQRAALEAAFDADGPGTLVHPYKGVLRVYCKYPGTRLRELSRAGRAAYFDAVFVEAGGPEPPSPSVSTADTTQSAASAAEPLVAGAYAPAYDGQSATVQSAFSAALASVQTAVSDALTAVGDAAAQLGQDLETLAGASPDDASGFAGALQVLLSNYVLNVVAAAVVAVDASLQPGYQDWSRLPPLPADPSYGLAALAQSGSSLVPPSASGTILANWTMLVNLVAGSAALALAALYAQTDFASAEDADAARAQAYAIFVAQIEAAAGNDALVQAWRGVMTASVADLTARAAAAPGLATLVTPSPMPALALAQLLYQDGTQAAVLVQRNSIPHPLFCPLKIEYLQP